MKDLYYVNAEMFPTKQMAKETIGRRKFDSNKWKHLYEIECDANDLFRYFNEGYTIWRANGVFVNTIIIDIDYAGNEGTYPSEFVYNFFLDACADIKGCNVSLSPSSIESQNTDNPIYKFKIFCDTQSIEIKSTTEYAEWYEKEANRVIEMLISHEMKKYGADKLSEFAGYVENEFEPIYDTAMKRFTQMTFGLPQPEKAYRELNCTKVWRPKYMSEYEIGSNGFSLNGILFEGTAEYAPTSNQDFFTLTGKKKNLLHMNLDSVPIDLSQYRGARYVYRDGDKRHIKVEMTVKKLTKNCVVANYILEHEYNETGIFGYMSVMRSIKTYIEKNMTLEGNFIYNYHETKGYKALEKLVIDSWRKYNDGLKTIETEYKQDMIRYEYEMRKKETYKEAYENIVEFYEENNKSSETENDFQKFIQEAINRDELDIVREETILNCEFRYRKAKNILKYNPKRPHDYFRTYNPRNEYKKAAKELKKYELTNMTYEELIETARQELEIFTKDEPTEEKAIEILCKTIKEYYKGAFTDDMFAIMDKTNEINKKKIKTRQENVSAAHSIKHKQHKQQPKTAYLNEIDIEKYLKHDKSDKIQTIAKRILEDYPEGNINTIKKWLKEILK